MISRPVVRNSLYPAKQRADRPQQHYSNSSSADGAAAAKKRTETIFLRIDVPLTETDNPLRRPPIPLMVEEIIEAPETPTTADLHPEIPHTTDYRDPLQGASIYLKDPSMTPQELEFTTKHEQVQIWLDGLTSEAPPPPPCALSPNPAPREDRGTEYVSRLEKLRRMLRPKMETVRKLLKSPAEERSPGEKQRVLELAAERVRNRQKSQRMQAEAKKNLAEIFAGMCEVVPDSSEGCVTQPHAQRGWRPPIVEAPPIPAHCVRSETPIATVEKDLRSILVTLARPDKESSFGFGIGETAGGDLIICNVCPGGPADGKLQVGDFLYMINNGMSKSLNRDSAVELIKSITELTLGVLRGADLVHAKVDEITGTPDTLFTSPADIVKRVLGYEPKTLSTATDLRGVRAKIDTGMMPKSRQKDAKTQLQEKDVAGRLQTRRRQRQRLHTPGGGNNLVPIGKMPKKYVPKTVP